MKSESIPPLFYLTVPVPCLKGNHLPRVQVLFFFFFLNNVFCLFIWLCCWLLFAALEITDRSGMQDLVVATYRLSFLVGASESLVSACGI